MSRFFPAFAHPHVDLLSYMKHKSYLKKQTKKKHAAFFPNVNKTDNHTFCFNGLHTYMQCTIS